MKVIITALCIFSLYSCKENIQQKLDITTSKTIEYPSDINKIFDNHGSIELWKSMSSLSYDMEGKISNEKQTIDLKSRIEKIEGANFTSGWNGTDYWVEADTSYKGNPKFYTNLIFYFYAMPFVLGDEGINYEKSTPLDFEGVQYPGYRITYGDSIGISPKDEYFIHYDPQTFEMAWLGYTVTFFSGEKSEKTSWIRYNDWGSHNGLKLPNSLTWYKTDDRKITEPRNTRNFTKINISTTPLEPSIFDKTPGAKIVD